MTTRLTFLAGVVLVAGLSAASGQRVGIGAVTAAGPVADFRDVAASAGLTARTVIGGEHTKEYILETTGGGVAILDYDNDGWPDIFLVNGRAPRTLFQATRRRRATCTETTATARSSDVTAKAGVGGERMGTGRLRRRLRQRRLRRSVRHLLRPIRCSIATTATAPSADVTRQSGLVGSPARAGIPARHSSTSIATAIWTCSCPPTSPTRTRPATRAGAAATASGKGSRVMCGPQGLAGSQNMLFRGNGDGTFSDVSEKAGLLARPAGLRLHAARPRLRQRRLARRLRRQRLRRVAALPQQSRRNVQGRRPAGGRRADRRRPRPGRHGRHRRRLRPRRLARHRQDELRRRHAFLVSQPGSRHCSRMRRAQQDWLSTRDTSAGVPGFSTSTWIAGRDILIVNGHVYPEADRLGGHYSYEQPKLLYRNLGNGRFEDVSMRAGPALLEKKASRGAAFGDLFNTGMQDIVVNNMDDPPEPAAQLRGARGPRAAGAARRHALESQRDRRPRDGVGLRPPAHRRSAQRRKLLFAQRSADPHGPREPDTSGHDRNRLAERRGRDDLRGRRGSAGGHSRRQRRDSPRAAGAPGAGGCPACRARRTAVSCVHVG